MICTILFSTTWIVAIICVCIMLICMPMIAIKKWKSRNHPVPKSNIRTNSYGGDSFELNAISIICHPPSDESNESEPNPIEIFEQLPNGKLCLLKVPKRFVPVQRFCVRPKIYLHIVPVTNILCQTKR